MMRLGFLLAFLFSCLSLSGCESTYYAAMEKVGQHKRDILVSRVEDANDAQQEAQEEFSDALTHLTSLLNFNGDELSQQYEIGKSHFEHSKKAAQLVSERITAIEKVAVALFAEWQAEINLYSSAALKAQSERKLSLTQAKYRNLINTMHAVEGKMPPVLSALQDNVLFLKHNLNAKAIGALEGEFQKIKRDVLHLIKDMNIAIKQSNQFIEQIKQ